MLNYLWVIVPVTKPSARDLRAFLLVFPQHAKRIYSAGKPVEIALYYFYETNVIFLV